jgi:hypothetical protein
VPADAVPYDEFEAAAPAIAGPIRERFTATGLALLATLCRDGSPRISPIEVSFQDGRLYVGMMPNSRKSLDLRADPRCALITPIADRHDQSGEGKLFAEAVELRDPAEVAAVLARAVEGTDVDPSVFGDSPAFEIRIRGAAWQHVDGDSWSTSSWSSAGGLRDRRRDGPAGDVVDVTSPPG